MADQKQEVHYGMKLLRTGVGRVQIGGVRDLRTLELECTRSRREYMQLLRDREG